MRSMATNTLSTRTIEGWLIKYGLPSYPIDLPNGAKVSEVILQDAFADSVDAILAGEVPSIEANIEHIPDDALARLGETGVNVAIENRPEGVYATITLASVIRNGASGPHRTYSAIFSDVTSLNKGDDVRMAGVKVGTVTGISLRQGGQGNTARVTFTVADSAPLDVGSTAELRFRPVLAQLPAEGATTTTSSSTTTTTKPGDTSTAAATTTTTTTPPSDIKTTPRDKNKADAQVVLPDKDAKNGRYALGPAGAVGKAISTARASVTQAGEWIVELEMTSSGITACLNG